MRDHFAGLTVAIRGPHPATKDNTADFVGIEDDPLQ